MNIITNDKTTYNLVWREGVAILTSSLTNTSSKNTSSVLLPVKYQ
jgi:hypothetical protein